MRTGLSSGKSAKISSIVLYLAASAVRLLLLLVVALAVPGIDGATKASVPPNTRARRAKTAILFEKDFMMVQRFSERPWNGNMINLETK